MSDFKKLSNLEIEILRILEGKRLPSISKSNEPMSPQTDITIFFGIGDKEVENEWRLPLLMLVLNNLTLDEITTIVERNDKPSDFKSRLMNEKTELSDKIEKLDSFLNSENFSKIDVKQQELLKLQIHTMKSYEWVLNQRINLL